MGQISEAWAELMAELDQRAPRSRTAVLPGSPVGPTVVARELGIELPDELQEWFTLHDGCGGGLFVDTRPGPQQGCVRAWDKTEADDDYGEGPVAPSLTALIRSVTGSLRDRTAAIHGYEATIRSDTLEWLPAGEEPIG